MAKTTEHPSNVLYRGEAQGMRHALELMVAQYEHEAALCESQDLDDDRQPTLTETMRSGAEKARKMLQDYDRARREMEDRLIGMWIASDDSEISHWAALLDLRSYEQLAV